MSEDVAPQPGVPGMDPLARMAAAAEAPPAALEAAKPSIFRRLLQPSPRSMEELNEELLAQMLNGVVDARTGTSAGSESQIGESVTDCTYALMGNEGGGPSAQSPLARLGMSAAKLIGKLRARRPPPPPPVQQGGGPQGGGPA